MTAETDRAPRGYALPRGALIALTLLVVLGPMTSDLYLPAFPRIAEDLRMSAAQVQASLSAALLGVALGQLVFGPLSDAIGRKAPLLAATAVLVAASTAIVVVDSLEWMLALRLIQGFGGAGGAVVGIAIARDAYQGSRLVAVLARLSLLSGLAPVVAPFLGSLLLNTMDWRGIFGVLALYGLAMVILCATVLPETLPGGYGGIKETGHTVAGRYAGIIRNRTFLAAAAIGSMLCAGVFAYVSASPFIFQDFYDLTPSNYGILFAINALAFAIGTQLTALTRKHPPKHVLGWALSAAAGAGLAMVPIATFQLGVLFFSASSFLFLLSAGFCLPVVQVIGLQENGQRAGTAAAALGFANFAVASLISPLPSLGGSPSVLSLGIVLLGVSLVGAWALRLMFGRALVFH